MLYSLYLPSLTDRAYPPIGRNDLRALVVVANPADPDKRYGLASFDVARNVARLQSIFGERTPATVLARSTGAAGSPTLDAIETHLTREHPTVPIRSCTSSVTVGSIRRVAGRPRSIWSGRARTQRAVRCWRSRFREQS